MSSAQPSILVVTGEVSGEEHAAGLVRALSQRLGGRAGFFGSGGEKMKSAGVEILGDVSELGAIGPAEAIRNLRAYWNLFRTLRSEAGRRGPQLAILVDFPDFNLRLAGRLKRLGIPVCYFISPQVWAWRQGRVKQIRRWVDLMLVILPFEEEFYRRHQVAVRYVGHPTASRLAAAVARQPEPREGSKRVALLPGSRRGEVDMNLPTHLDAAAWIAERLEAKFEIARAASVENDQIESLCTRWSERTGRQLDVTISDGSEEVLARSDAAIVKSGTSTLEAMLLGIPFAMSYRVSSISWILLRPFVRTQRYCLANLVAENDVAPEFVQARATAENIGDYVVRILQDSKERQRVVDGLAEGRRRLGVGDAFQEAADQIWNRFFQEPAESRGSA